VSLGALLTGVGRALVSWGLGGGGEDDAAAADVPARLVVREWVPLYEITTSSVEPLYTIAASTVEPLYRIEVFPVHQIKVGATATVRRFEVRSSVTGELVDFDECTVTVDPEKSDQFALEYGTAPTDGNIDAIVRISEGRYRLQLDITEERGSGTWKYKIVTTGAKAVIDGSFEVFDLLI
jgi:hypothetical protein